MSNIVKNISSLYSIQIINYLFPLLTIPYFTRTLGVEGYGKLVLAQSIALYGAAIINYGFSLSATRKIAIVRNNSAEVTNIVTNTVSGMVVLSLLVIILIFLCEALGAFYPIRTLIFEVLLLTLVSGWNFQWYFRGIEKMEYLAMLEAFNKALFTISIFILVKNRNDEGLILGLQSLFILLSTIIGLVLLRRHVFLKNVSFLAGAKTLVEGKETFIFTSLATIHSNIPVVLIAYLASPAFAGIFAGAYKLTKQIMLTLAQPVWDALYPRLSYSLHSSEYVFRQKEVYRILLLNLAFGVFYTVILFFCAEPVIRIIFGDEFVQGRAVVQVLVFACPFIILNVSILNIFISQKLEKVVNISTLLNILVLTVLTIFFANFFTMTGGAIAVVISEIVLLSSLIFFYTQKHTIGKS